MSINIGYYAVPGLKKSDLSVLRKNMHKIDLEDIVSEVAEETGVPVKSIKGTRREVPYVKARHIFFLMAKRHTNLTLSTIGKFADGKDHTTVRHGLISISNYMDTEDDLRDMVTRIEERIISTVKYKL